MTSKKIKADNTYLFVFTDKPQGQFHVKREYTTINGKLQTVVFMEKQYFQDKDMMHLMKNLGLQIADAFDESIRKQGHPESDGTYKMEAEIDKIIYGDKKLDDDDYKSTKVTAYLDKEQCNAVCKMEYEYFQKAKPESACCNIF
eukprot:403366402